MFPNGPGIASPECSWRGDALSTGLRLRVLVIHRGEPQVSVARVPAPVARTILWRPRLATISSISGATAARPRSMMLCPPILTTFIHGRLGKSGVASVALWVATSLDASARSTAEIMTPVKLEIRPHRGQAPLQYCVDAILGVSVRPRTSAPEGRSTRRASVKTIGQALITPKTCIIMKASNVASRNGRVRPSAWTRRGGHDRHEECSAGRRQAC
jgi:hypothetical protein